MICHTTRKACVVYSVSCLVNVKPGNNLHGYRSLVRRGTGPKGHWSECYGVGIHCREVVRIEAQQSKHSSLCKLGGVLTPPPEGGVGNSLLSISIIRARDTVKRVYLQCPTLSQTSYQGWIPNQNLTGTPPLPSRPLPSPSFPFPSLPSR